MLRLRRRGLPSSLKKMHRASRAVAEPLENRLMLYTITGGGMSAAGLPIPGTPLQYTDARGNAVRVQASGNVTAELIFAGPIVNGLVTPAEPVLFPASTGLDLFQIYVAKSDINSIISVTAFDKTTGQILPFTGAVATYDVNLAFPTSVAFAPPAGTGPITLGYVPTTQPAPAFIKGTTGGAAYGVRPAGLNDLPGDITGADLSAGLIVAPGLDLGRFLFGGAVMGRVEVPGSMDLFYGGWIITGDARGAFPGNQQLSVGTNPYGFPTSFGGVVPRGNFHVGGDLRTLATVGPIGWSAQYGGATVRQDPIYLTGTDIVVGGRLGNIDTRAGSAASIHVLGGAYNTGARVQIPEDYRAGFPITAGGGADFQYGLLAAQASPSPLLNDTFNTAQYLAPFNSPFGPDVVDLNGSLGPGIGAGNPIDFYAVGLMAGQRITLMLSSLAGTAHVGVFDPDGRLIATDYNNAGRFASQVGSPFQFNVNLPFSFTADRPGAYRIAVGGPNDTDFTGVGGSADYNLVVSGLGKLAAGGILSGGDMLDISYGQAGVEVDSGDLGGVDIIPGPGTGATGGGTGAAASFTTYGVISHKVLPPNFVLNSRLSNPYPLTNPAVPSILVGGGNLRSFDSGQIGIIGAADGSPDFAVPLGSVGLLRTRLGMLFANPSETQRPSPLSVGKDYQVIDAAGNLSGGYVANGSLGVIRAGSIGGGLASSSGWGTGTAFVADNDSTGNDGFIDLIDCAGDFAGPAIWHGPGGNVRYIRVGGTVTSDPTFTVGTPIDVVHGFNEAVTFTDDSGATVTFTPLGASVPNPTYDPNALPGTPNSFRILGPSLNTVTYPIRSGGVVVLDVESSGGLTVAGSSSGGGGSVEVGRIEVHGTGVTPLRTVDNRLKETVVSAPPFSPAYTSDPTVLLQPLEVNIYGNVPVDVSYIAVLGPQSQTDLNIARGSTAFSAATRIDNNTPGELVSINAASILSLTAHGTIGLTKSSIPGNSVNFREVIAAGSAGGSSAAAGTGGATTPERFYNAAPTEVRAGTGLLGNTYPFVQQTYGVVVDGDVVSIRSGQGLGNIVVHGIIGDLAPNADGVRIPSVFAGVNGPVWAWGAIAGITHALIGQGMPAQGTGMMSRSGIFSDGYIGAIGNGSAGSDVRAPVVFATELHNLTLNNGSIINTSVVQQTVGSVGVGTRTTSTFEAVRAGALIGFMGTSVPTPIGSRFFPMGPIVVNGAGSGIIGSSFFASDISSIAVNNGFGILTSVIAMPGTAKIGRLQAAGWGIRSTSVFGGVDMDSLLATGNGSDYPVTRSSASVRPSDFVTPDPVFSRGGAALGVDPVSGEAISGLNDVNSVLGTDPITPSIPGVTDTGVIENTLVKVQRNLKLVAAQTIRARPLTAIDDPSDPSSPANSLFPMQFSAGNMIGSVQTRGLIDGLRIVTGKLRRFTPGSDVVSLNMTVAGPVGSLKFKRSLSGNSSITASGPNGKIDSVSVAGDMIGSIRAASRIGSITIGHNLLGNITIDGTTPRASLGVLRVGGSILNGSLNINGNITRIETAGSFGTAPTDTFVVNGNLGMLRVGTARPGALVTNISVRGQIGTINVNGRIDGNIVAGGSLNSLNVNAPGQPGAINGSINVGVSLKKATINGANINNSITAGQDIASLMLTGGSVAPLTAGGAPVTIKAASGSIHNMVIRGGNLFGSVLANNSIDSLAVDGNLGNGVNALTIAAAAIRNLSIGGSILKLAKVQTGPLGTLAVGGNIEAGAQVIASSLARNEIRGSVAPGALVIG